MSSNIERSKGTVRFTFKESKSTLETNKSKPFLIYMFFTYGKNRFKYSTGYKCSYNDWDFKKQRIKNKNTIINKDEANTVLNDLTAFINKLYPELSKEFVNTPKDLLKYHLDVFTKKIAPKGSSNNDMTFFNIIDKYIDEKEQQISIITIRSYKQTKKRLEEYEKSHRIKLSFESIDISFYNKFKKFLEKENYSLNTIGKHIKTLKTFLNYALNEGYTTNQKFKNKDFKVIKEITTEIYLTDKEIKKMLDKDLSTYPILSHARDIFLIGCYTGQRISDYNNLKEEDIITLNDVTYFKFKQKKNRKYNREVLCPITKEIKLIMDNRHNGNPPKPIAESILNDSIKQIGIMLKFNERVKCEHTQGGKLITEMIPKHQLIKSHTARRSFCTNKYKAGMPVFDIMLFSGHSTEKEFYKYIRIQNEERASHIVKSGFFNI